MKLWAKTEEYSEGKFLVVRRDGSVPLWPHFVMGARDPHVPAALRAYAIEYEQDKYGLGYDHDYYLSILQLADDFEAYAEVHGYGDPDAGPHREDHEAVLRAMRGEMSHIFVCPDKEHSKK
jgi:hypothetical protein